MNRLLFILLQIVVGGVSYFLFKQEIFWAEAFCLYTTVVLVSLRRRYLHLKPWWWASLRDFPKYFEEP